MVKRILVFVVILIAAILAFAATRPDTFHYERQITINAPAEKIYPLINDLKGQQRWSPWEKIDPDMKRTLSANTWGKGATYEWDGNKEVGQGKVTITDNVDNEKVVMALDFIKPFEGHSTGEITLVKVPEGTRVTWAMYGPQPYFSKLMSLVMNCEKMVTAQFEKGLADLKTIAEQ